MKAHNFPEIEKMKILTHKFDMKIMLPIINMMLIVLVCCLILFGLIFLFLSNDALSTALFFSASIILPFLVALKIIEFLMDKQIQKVVVSVILLSVVCILSILVAFI